MNSFEKQTTTDVHLKQGAHAGKCDLVVRLIDPFSPQLYENRVQGAPDGTESISLSP